VSFPDHFSAIAARYAQYRPHYPAELIDTLAALSPARDAAWDAGCGNGQLSVPLGEWFARVWATDASQQQLAAARPHPHVDYRCAPAETSGLADASVDLAVAAQAAHWFDWERYVAEVARVARPGALAAVIAYNVCSIADRAGELVERYYHELESYWPAGRVHIVNGYRDLVWPWPAVDPPALELVASWTRDELAGYIATWSATQRLTAAEGSERYDALCENLARVWRDGERRDVKWPLTIRLARRP
jgi:SAM-dependent methyltransferase